MGFYTGNDVHENVTKFIWKLVDGRLVLDERREQSGMRRVVVLLKVWLQAHVQSYVFVREKMAQIQPARMIFDWLGLLEVRDAEAVRKSLPHEVSVLLKDAPAGLEGAWRLTTAILSAAVGIARAGGANVLVVAIPSVYQVDPKRWRALSGLGVTESELDPEKPHRRVSEWGKAQGVPVLDLLPEFREAAARGTPLYFEEGHWNERAHELAAALIFRMLVDGGFVGGSGSG